jgi:hypothetical protein
VSQPAKDSNSIAPYTYVTPLRPMHMAPPILKREIAKLPHRAMTEFQYTSSI